MSRKRVNVKKKNNTLVNVLLVGLILVVTYFGGGDLIKDKKSETKTKQEQRSLGDKKAKLKGVIVQVSDGDTVILKDEAGEKHKVRLNGIDAPEMGQTYGEESKSFLKNMVLNKRVEVEQIGIDQYKRVLGVLFVDGLDVNKSMLEQGMAWQYKYNKDETYAELVSQARRQKKNIWSDPNAQDPHAWRKENK